MLQYIIRSSKRKEFLAPAGIIFALLIVLSLIIVLGQFFHQSLQEEMAGQFNQQQLLFAREVAMNIESYIDHVYKDIRVISHLPDVDHIHQSPRIRGVAESINFSLQNEALVTIKVLDKNGITLYDSSFPGREQVDLSQTDYFKKARMLPRNEKLITDLLDIHSTGEKSKEFIVAVPIYRQASGRGLREFSGAVLAVLSMEGITRRYLSPIKSGTHGYAWMMDSEGTLLYHPTQEDMVGKNLYRSDKSCFNCHKSFDVEKKMIEGKEETSGFYVSPNGENKLAAFYKFPIARKHWVVVVSAPYAEVINLMQKSRRFYTLLVLSLFVTTIVASVAMIVMYKNKIKVEEKEKHIEEHRRLEREIEITKNYLEDIIENTKTNLMVLDKELVIRTVNTAQARTLGHSKQDILGKPFSSLFREALPPYDGVPIETILHQTAEGRSFELKDYRITGLQESPLFLTLNISPLMIEGKIPGVLIASNDVSTRVQLEEALKQYTLELEDKVERGTATAIKLEQQVLHSEKLAALGRLAAGVAHEINNPLTSISTFTQLLREMAQDEFTQNSLDVISNHIQRITDIVRRLSTFARTEALVIKEVQINDVLNSTMDLMRLDKRMKNTIDIAVSLARDLPKTMIDEARLSQVFINIILNALDAMSEGGTLTVATRQDTDEHGTDALFVSFHDTGVGIPKTDLAKIFDPFYTTKEAGKGTGLGLSLSYDIIRRFKGDIKVDSEPGKGTMFTIILPRVSENS